jgi:hypothetical protein
MVYVKRAQNPWRQVARATKFCTVAPNFCRSSVCLLLYIALLKLRILRWILHFWNIC